MSNPRANYSPIVNRRPLKLPEDARVAVWVVVNVEEWDISAPMARTVLPTPQGASVIPDIPNYSWHDYGMRVGFWRIKEVLDRRGIRATVSLNASVCNSYPQIAEAMLEAQWEIMGHGFTQRALPLEDDEHHVIRKTIATIREATGTAPRGWMGPGLAETMNTPDILAEEGIEYVCDWVNDDQPYLLKVKSGRLVSIPYTVELNDIPIYIVQHHRSPEMFERGKDHFDTLYREGLESARIMAIATHPYITGVPHRIGYFDRLLEYLGSHEGVLFMTGGEILDWYISATEEVGP
ncbi:MAG: polysaccharide deacetylase family protein [Dehalococcoidia bacterium]